MVKESACQCRRCGLFLGSGRSLNRNNNPLQWISCLGDPLDRGEPGGLQCMGSRRVGHGLGQGLAIKQQRDNFEGCSEFKMKRNGNNLSIGVEEGKRPKIFEVSDQCTWPDGW